MDGTPGAARARRIARRIAALCFLVLILTSQAAATAPELRARGTVSGELEAGSTLMINLLVEHRQGWQHVTELHVNLELRGDVLDQLKFDVAIQALSVVGGGSSVGLGESETLQGSYIEVDASRVTLSAKGRELRVGIPIGVSADPPPGARLTYAASALPLASTGFKPLTAPVEADEGFSWGTLGLAIAFALFAGGFIGNTFASRRRRPARPSVYGAVQRRLAEDKERAR